MLQLDFLSQLIMKESIFRLLFVFFCCQIVDTTLSGQNINNLRAEREALLQEIDRTNRMLQSKQTTRETNLQQLNLLTREITIRESFLADIRNEISIIDASLEENQRQINQLENEIESIKTEYARLIQDTYKRRNALDELIFFLSANGFSEAYQRYRLLQEYTRYRQQQAEKLKASQNLLFALQEDIQIQRLQKEEALKEIENEYVQLSSNRQQKNVLIRNLQREERWLREQLNKQQQQAEELENRILEYIRTSRAGTTGENFGDFKGKLIWPVSRGRIVNSFGEHPHPVLSNVTIKNNGIDIQTSGNDDVFAVHNGEISRVVAIPGYNTAVIVRHGKFLTVYANLRTVKVAQGQIVTAGSNLGTVYREDNDSGGILHFEIWEENQKLDPVNWLVP
ncbi:Septal ring factor EnvC, activator of murein hydrolases AmiA and AmiB [Alkalitalea saponilacus]|uniref:Septal ring factor EnvC, activator of murein hydrolases AmiA and AmiB n=2 Tax=Alkalitalea saponilacus TaxID=889453 RepID=A0A1T5EAJ5_9BACT|nr:Septal ring factor EnvC, activator of murein hydrolases AmiA and AmiB [Alkalitalea saponilacus]